MSDLILTDEPEFFAPVSSDVIDGLVGQYDNMKSRIEHIAGAVDQDAMRYFLDGNSGDTRYSAPSVERLFELKGAVAALNSAYWSKAMHLTDVLHYMPQKRRDDWHDSIRNNTCPDFQEETVRSTLESLLLMRSQFLAERVDGIFRGLSGEHVTNSPAAFGKRMIVAHVLNEWHSENHSTCGLINDLRCVIAKFMGRDEPSYNASSGLIRKSKCRWGEWMQVDGGALKIRVYKKGTAHIEVHPDMAWRLNSVLASIYPMAIPAEFRTKPKRKAKEIELIKRPLSFAVIDVLACVGQGYRWEKRESHAYPREKVMIKNSLMLVAPDKHARAEAARVFEAIGGVLIEKGLYQFDYDPREVLDDIVASGCIPDHKSHQFYPTPVELAQKAVELAEIGNLHVCLEPSAGIGGLADFMPKDRTICVEVSELHCSILKAKGFKVDQADFLSWKSPIAPLTFDRVILNPPFDRGQWQAHLEEAASMVTAGGRLVAILPTSAPNKTNLSGFNLEWHGPYDNQFSGTSISVIILVASKQ